MPGKFTLAARPARRAATPLLLGLDHPSRLSIGRAAADWAKNGRNAAKESFEILARARIQRRSTHVPKGPAGASWRSTEQAPDWRDRVPPGFLKKARAKLAARRAARFSLSGKPEPAAWRKTEFFNNSTVNQRGRMPLFANDDLPRGTLRGQRSIFDAIGGR